MKFLFPAIFSFFLLPTFLNAWIPEWKKLSVDPSDAEKDSALFMAKYCGRRCQNGRLVVLEKYCTLPECFPCDCSKYCSKKGTCCPTVALDSSGEEKGSYTTIDLEEMDDYFDGIHSRLKCEQTVAPDTGRLLRVATCPESWNQDENHPIDIKEKCENPTGDSFESFTPYIEEYSGLTFANIFCARCNGFVPSVPDWYGVGDESNLGSGGESGPTTDGGNNTGRPIGPVDPRPYTGNNGTNTDNQPQSSTVPPLLDHTQPRTGGGSPLPGSGSGGDGAGSPNFTMEFTTKPDISSGFGTEPVNKREGTTNARNEFGATPQPITTSSNIHTSATSDTKSTTHDFKSGMTTESRVGKGGTTTPNVEPGESPQTTTESPINHTDPEPGVNSRTTPETNTRNVSDPSLDITGTNSTRYLSTSTIASVTPETGTTDKSRNRTNTDTQEGTSPTRLYTTSERSPTPTSTPNPNQGHPITTSPSPGTDVNWNQNGGNESDHSPGTGKRRKRDASNHNGEDMSENTTSTTGNQEELTGSNGITSSSSKTTPGSNIGSGEFVTRTDAPTSNYFEDTTNPQIGGGFPLGGSSSVGDGTETSSVFPMTKSPNSHMSSSPGIESITTPDYNSKITTDSLVGRKDTTHAGNEYITKSSSNLMNTTTDMESATTQGFNLGVTTDPLVERESTTQPGDVPVYTPDTRRLTPGTGQFETITEAPGNGLGGTTHYSTTSPNNNNNNTVMNSTPDTESNMSDPNLDNASTSSTGYLSTSTIASVTPKTGTTDKSHNGTNTGTQEGTSSTRLYTTSERSPTPSSTPNPNQGHPITTSSSPGTDGVSNLNGGNESQVTTNPSSNVQNASNHNGGDVSNFRQKLIHTTRHHDVMLERIPLKIGCDEYQTLYHIKNTLEFFNAAKKSGQCFSSFDPFPSIHFESLPTCSISFAGEPPKCHNKAKKEYKNLCFDLPKLPGLKVSKYINLFCYLCSKKNPILVANKGCISTNPLKHMIDPSSMFDLTYEDAKIKWHKDQCYATQCDSDGRLECASGKLLPIPGRNQYCTSAISGVKGLAYMISATLVSVTSGIESISFDQLIDAINGSLTFQEASYSIEFDACPGKNANEGRLEIHIIGTLRSPLSISRDAFEIEMVRMFTTKVWEVLEDDAYKNSRSIQFKPACLGADLCTIYRKRTRASEKCSHLESWNNGAPIDGKINLLDLNPSLNCPHYSYVVNENIELVNNTLKFTISHQVKPLSVLWNEHVSFIGGYLKMCYTHIALTKWISDYGHPLTIIAGANLGSGNKTTPGYPSTSRPYIPLPMQTLTKTTTSYNLELGGSTSGFVVFSRLSGTGNSTSGTGNAIHGTDHSTRGTVNSTPGTVNSTPGTVNSTPGTVNSTHETVNSTHGTGIPNIGGSAYITADDVSKGDNLQSSQSFNLLSLALTCLMSFAML